MAKLRPKGFALAGSKSSQANRVRVVGGVFKRTVLPVPDIAGLRPTPERVRETLFNWLAGRVEQANCLDLFAGTGALGVEAASRGAARVVLNEVDPAALRALRHLVQRLGDSADRSTSQAAQVIQVSSTHPSAALAVGGDAARYDLIFLDPPFGTDWLARLLTQLKESLAPEGLVYIESDSPLQDEMVRAAGLVVFRQGRAGQVHYHLLRQVAAI